MNHIENDFAVAYPDKYGRSYSIERKVQPVGPAEVAMHLLTAWGRITTVPTNENPTGKEPNWRLLTPEELIERSTRTAELFHAEIVKRGWAIILPARTEAAE